LEDGEEPIPPFSICLNAHRSTEDITASPTFKDYLELITSKLPAAKYQFDWWADFKCKGPPDNDIEIRLILDEGTPDELILFVENGQSYYGKKVFCQFLAIDLSAGIHIIKMQFRLFNGVGPVWMLAANMSLNNYHTIG
jgi:hypothetical protein